MTMLDVISNYFTGIFSSSTLLAVFNVPYIILVVIVVLIAYKVGQSKKKQKRLRA